MVNGGETGRKTSRRKIRRWNTVVTDSDSLLLLHNIDRSSEREIGEFHIFSFLLRFYNICSELKTRLHFVFISRYYLVARY